MGYQLSYNIYNPGQYPAEVQVQLDAMCAAGWRVNQAMPAYNELYILWERDVADPPPSKPAKDEKTADKLAGVKVGVEKASARSQR